VNLLESVCFSAFKLCDDSILLKLLLDYFIEALWELVGPGVILEFPVAEVFCYFFDAGLEPFCGL